MRVLLEDRRVEVNRIGSDRRTSIWAALNSNLNPEALRLLIEFGANPLSPGYCGTRAPTFVAGLGHVEMLEILAMRHPEIVLVPEPVWGLTPLHEAADEGHLEAVKWLVERGANLTARDRESDTPLGMAVFNDRTHVVEFLLKQPGVTETLDTERIKGRVPLLISAMTHVSDTGVFEKLLKAGADPNIKDENGTPALMVAIKYVNRKYLKDRCCLEDWRKKVVRLLLKARGIDTTVRDGEGRSLVGQAFKHGRYEIVDMMGDMDCALGEDDARMVQTARDRKARWERERLEGVDA